MSRSTLAQVINVPQEAITLPKPGIKHVGFRRRGQAWFCTTGLPSDVTVEVDEMIFHLHKFPLTSRSGKLSKLVADATSTQENPEEEEDDDDDNEDGGVSHRVCCIRLQGMPGGPNTFEQVAKFCYGVKIELSATNVAALRCAAEYLHMTAEYGERNLVSLTESFLNYVILTSWKDSVATLQSCEALLPLAEKLCIVKKCIDSIAIKACTDPNFMMGNSPLRSPDGTLLWNGISTGARQKNVTTDWWYEDISMLSLPLFKSVIGSMEEKGLRAETIAGALMYYAKKHIPGLNRRQDGRSSRATSLGAAVSPSPVLQCEAEQVFLLETIESLLPSEHGVVSTSFLFGLLKIATILNAHGACKDNLEKRISTQFERATLDDILIPNYTHSSETLYDMDCVQRILQQFLSLEKAQLLEGGDASSPYDNDNNDRAQLTSPSSVMSPLRVVARLLDAYLGEVAPDMNLKPAKFQALAECLPHYARALDDGLYRAIDIFIKGHSWMSQEEKEALCSVMDCRKLSLEACTHAAQNERLPMRVVVQVLFMEQMQLRVAIMGCLDGTMSRPSAATPDVATDVGRYPPSARERNEINQRAFLACMAAQKNHQCDVPLATHQNHPVNVLTGNELLSVHPPDAQVGRSRTPHSGTAHHKFLSAHESQALRTDIVGLHRRIGELERECSRLRTRLHRKAAGWASLSAKLTCRSISDIADMSGQLQDVPPSHQHFITQPTQHPSRARLSSPSGPPVSSSSSTHSFYSPSPYRAKQALV